MNVALRPDSLNLISICTGGGGLDLGVELAIPSARSVCLVEREAFAVSQLVSAMQEGLLAPAPVWSDARTFDGRAWRGAVDGLIGGIPCQPHSLAGKRLERADSRDLWSTARRIIVQSGAWFVGIENVGGMLSSGGAERVWRDLGRLGFACEIGLFTAAEVGASHQRERTFILAVADARCPGRQQDAGGPLGDEGQDEGRPSQHDNQFERAGADFDMADAIGNRGRGRQSGGEYAADADASDEGMEHPKSVGRRARRAKPEGQCGQTGAAIPEHKLGNPIRRGCAGRENDQIERSEQRALAERAIERPIFPPGPDDLPSWADTLASSPELEPAFRRVADGMASRLDTARVDRLRMLGNGVVPLQAAYAVRTLATRLASRGSAGAARLVRMMEQSA
ncbi:DNA cytosine methyltransferase [Devosia sp. Naph2]|uniref:DNA cytosine methyltransferase n=1 Tax=Devosia polycyclovorans TaxID=3345148 RepID=UPI0035CFA5F0